MPPPPLPLEYIYRNRTHFLVLASCADDAHALLASAGGDGEALAGGRGGARRVSFQDGHAVLRPCRRGGLVQHLLGDAYLLRNRPRAEFLVHCAAFEAGAPVPEPLGVRWRRHGALVRGALLTRYIDASPLPRESAGASGSDAPHRLAGGAVAAMHKAGVLHADLNAHNILVTNEHAWVVDLDRARIVRQPSAGQRAWNLLRLRRSYAKLGIPLDRFDAFMEGYGPFDFTALPRAFHAVRQAITGRPR